MNFDYSYRAFLISCLLVGNLVLLLVSVKLTKTVEDEETVMPVEYAETAPEELDEKISEEIKIQTNTAYNEAEQYISEIENSRNNSSENPISPEDESPTSAASESSRYLGLNQAKNKLEQVKKKLNENGRSKSLNSGQKNINRNTTLSYRLKDRAALYLPNPVYTCDAGGKIVISIAVNDRGKVIKSDYNKSLSNSANGCLIESALYYASRAKFSTLAGKKEQLGTITYLFPGQN